MNELTRMEGTIATGGLDSNANYLFKKYTFTSTSYISPEKRFSIILEECARLKKETTISLEDINRVENLVYRLPKNTEMYEESLFHLRSLKRKMPNKFKSSVTDKEKGLEEELICLKHKGFINAGKYGRKWIVDQISNKVGKETLVGVANNKLQLLDDILNELKNAEDIDNIVHLFKRLDISLPGSRLDKMIAEKWLEDQTSEITTLTQVVQKVESYVKALKEEEFIEDTTDIEVFNLFQSD